jgi:hypothetical protein
MLEHNYVYAIQCGRHFKIGKATDVKARLSAIQSSNPTPCVLVHSRRIVYELVLGAERAAHTRLQDKRVSGEWFRCTKRQAIRAIDAGCREAVERRAIYTTRESIIRALGSEGRSCREQMVGLLRKYPNALDYVGLAHIEPPLFQVSAEELAAHGGPMA